MFGVEDFKLGVSWERAPAPEIHRGREKGARLRRRPLQKSLRMPGSMELRKKRVLVGGLARTGVATALFCAGHYAMGTGTETRAESELGEAPANLRAAGVTFELGRHPGKNVLAQDLIIPSPGVAR